MLLKVLDRLTLLGLLPEKGDFLTLKIVRKLREDLSFSEDEIQNLGIRQEEERIYWDQFADNGKDVQIGEKATDIIVDSLKKLNEQKQLTPQHMNLYESFVDKKD